VNWFEVHIKIHTPEDIKGKEAFATPVGSFFAVPFAIFAFD
jgi:hypothetical protein